MFEKFLHEVKAHPYIFGGVAVGVLLLFLWPSSSSSGTGTSAISAEESQAIADAAQSNTDLQIASDQVVMNGQNTAAAQAIALAGYASQNYVANQAAGVANFQTAAAVQAAGVAAGAQEDQDNAILASQNSAEQFIEYLANTHGIVPGDFSVAGFTAAGPSVDTPSTPKGMPLPQLTEYLSLLDHTSGLAGDTPPTTSSAGTTAATADTSGAH